MRGFPLLNLLLMLASVLALSIPLGMISGAKSESVAPAVFSSAQAAKVTTNISIRLAHPAVSVSLWRGLIELHEWNLAADGQRLEASLELPMPEQTIEFEVRLKWPEGTPQTVAEVTVEPDGFESKQMNLWGRDHTEEIVNFTWKKSAP